MARYREVERKFDADPGTPLPDLSGVGDVVTVTDPVQTHLEATYFDTADLRLAAHRITLRRRTGGEDEGWHLKVPAGGDERTEVRLPLGEATHAVPEALVREVRAVVRDRELVPVAIVRTTRLERHLLEAEGHDLAVVADDTVHAERLGDGSVELSTWREVEVELVEGDQELFDAVTARLEPAGMTRSATASKLQRVLGERAQRQADRELPRFVARACRRVDRLARAVDEAATPADRDHRLHEVRKAAKRARYAAESVAPVCGRPAVRLAKRMQALQNVLGEHQDSVVARQVLREIGVAAHQAGENAFTFGLLYGLERSRGEAAQRAYPPALRAASKKSVRRWMR